jgi:two-component system, LytTR family, sensor histidine kinase AlgZ
MSRSINQIVPRDGGQSVSRDVSRNAYGSALPDFRNVGILLRILLIVNIVALTAAVIQSPTLAGIGAHIIETAALVEPLLILTLVVLYALNGLLVRLPFGGGALAVIGVVLVLTTALYVLAQRYLPFGLTAMERYWLLVGLTTAMLLCYFDLRGRALSPAIAEARLQALQARIRPHFLFNSINAVLSLVRQEPRRAETALEDMAELFRVLMAENRDLVPLAREVALCRQYLAIEQLRLGERLQVLWRTDGMPGDALVPPLVLQPLLENAVYHGIEPRTAPGVVSIEIHAVRDTVHAVLKNPYAPGGDHHAGNNMALGNIRERLQLHFDAEASLTSRVTDDSYEVHIVMPYRREGKGKGAKAREEKP